MTTAIPICLFPMRKIILDDDQSFTESILLKMHGKNFSGYNSPKQAMRYLLDEYKVMLTKDHVATLDITAAIPTTQRTINIQIDALQQTITNSAQHDVSVLFVDYHMPEMYGLDFLKEIQHLPMKKALITGERDYKIGVDALNSGLVDSYIRKDDPDFMNKFQQTALELEWKYFSSLSGLVTNMPDFSYLSNNHFIREFKQYIRDNNIVSFCLTDTDGNFLLKNKNSEQKYLLVRDRAHLQELSKLALDDEGSNETINRLQEGNVIPFFGHQKYWQIAASEWDGFLHPANSVMNDEKLVWAAVNSEVV
ncbi:MAG: response regulator [Gammaproteobacteria bacterium]